MNRVSLPLDGVDPEVLGALPAAFAQKHQVFPLQKDERVLRLAVADPLAMTVFDEIRILTGLSVEPVLVDSSEIREAIDRFYVERLLRETSGADAEVVVQEEEDIGDLERMAGEATTVRLVNLLFHQAVQERASDIHVEPFEHELKVRFRVDGVLREVAAPPKRLQQAIASRIKLMAGMNIAERRLPQDGRIRFRVSGRDLDVRVSAMPTVHGESIVMRMLDKSSVLFGLEELGMTEWSGAVFRRLIERPYGIILVTGPTGSGKTTTLYAALAEIASPEKKIITIEDPVEYELPGINQIPVRPKIGLTFAGGLRSILRQDPDVIMVGEIRDRETAEIAIQASLTGHLVFSTLHTNDAAGAMTRLLDMGIDPYLVASTVQGVLAQRLVRRICPECRETHEVDGRELAAQGLGAATAEPGTAGSRPVEQLASDPGRVMVFRGRGCSACSGAGFYGRVGVFELLLVDSAVRELIMKRTASDEIKRCAVSSGMTTLREDGWRKALAGVTTVGEVLRATALDD